MEYIEQLHIRSYEQRKKLLTRLLRHKSFHGVIDSKKYERILIKENKLWKGAPVRIGHTIFPSPLIEELKIIQQYEQAPNPEMAHAIKELDLYSIIDNAIPLSKQELEEKLNYYRTSGSKVYLSIVDYPDKNGHGYTFDALKLIARKETKLNIWHLKPEYVSYFADQSLYIKSAWWTNRSTKTKLALIFDIDAETPLTPTQARIIGNIIYNELSKAKHWSFVVFSGRGLHVYTMLKIKDEENESQIVAGVTSIIGNIVQQYGMHIDLIISKGNKFIRLPGSINPRTGYKVQIVSGILGKSLDHRKYKTNSKYKRKNHAAPPHPLHPSMLGERYGLSPELRKQLNPIFTDSRELPVDQVIKLVKPYVFTQLSRPLYSRTAVFSIKHSPLLDKPTKKQQQLILSRFKRIIRHYKIEKLPPRLAFELLHMLTAQVLMETKMKEELHRPDYKISDPFILLARLVPIPVGMRHIAMLMTVNYMRFLGGKGPYKLYYYYILERETENDENSFKSSFEGLIERTQTKLNEHKNISLSSALYYITMFKRFFAFLLVVDPVAAYLINPFRNIKPEELVPVNPEPKKKSTTVDQLLKLTTGKFSSSLSYHFSEKSNMVKFAQFFIGARFGKSYLIRYYELFNLDYPDGKNLYKLVLSTTSASERIALFFNLTFEELVRVTNIGMSDLKFDVINLWELLKAKKEKSNPNRSIDYLSRDETQSAKMTLDFRERALLDLFYCSIPARFFYQFISALERYYAVIQAVTSNF